MHTLPNWTHRFSLFQSPSLSLRQYSLFMHPLPHLSHCASWSFLSFPSHSRPIITVTSSPYTFLQLSLSTPSHFLCPPQRVSLSRWNQGPGTQYLPPCHAVRRPPPWLCCVDTLIPSTMTHRRESVYLLCASTCVCTQICGVCRLVCVCSLLCIFVCVYVYFYGSKSRVSDIRSRTRR